MASREDCISTVDKNFLLHFRKRFDRFCLHYAAAKSDFYAEAAPLCEQFNISDPLLRQLIEFRSTYHKLRKKYRQVQQLQHGRAFYPFSLIILYMSLLYTNTLASITCSNITASNC